MSWYDGVLTNLTFPRWIRLTLLRYLWVRQGRPRTVPVIIKVGTLTSFNDGRKLVKNWSLNTQYMDEGLTLDAEALWDYLLLEYPETHTFSKETVE